VKKMFNKLQTALNELYKVAPERETIIQSMAVALLAEQNVLLLGNPGTGKTYLTRHFAEVFANDSFFHYLLTKTTKPEELFGPISFTALKQDRFEHNSADKMPTKQVVLLDEIFKAGSSLLNSLLTILNEKLFFNGTKIEKVPMRLCVGCSNEYPEDESLNALYDRFLIKFWVEYIQDRNILKSALTNGFAKTSIRFSSEEIDAMKDEVKQIDFSDKNAETLLNIKEALQAEGIEISDRTLFALPRLIKAKAYLSGRSTILPSDFQILAEIVWRKHTDRPIVAQVVGNVSDPFGSRLQAIKDQAVSLGKSLPSIDLVRNGQKTANDFIKDLVSPVSTNLQALLVDLEEIEDKTSPMFVEVSAIIEQNAKTCTDLARSALRAYKTA